MKGGADANGPTHGPHFDRELLFKFVQQVEGIPTFEIEFVDEDDDGRIAHAAHLHQAFGLCFDPFHTIDHQDNAVHSREGAVSVLGEVAVTRGIQEVDEFTGVVEGHHRGAHRDPALAFDLHEVARGAPSDLVAFHGASGLDGTTIEQEFLREGGLPRIGVADDGERAPVFDLFLQGHGACAILSEAFLVWGRKSRPWSKVEP